MTALIKSTRGRECRCTQCGALLGVRDGPHVHVRYKDLRIIGLAPMTLECRRCKTSNCVSPDAGAVTVT